MASVTPREELPVEDGRRARSERTRTAIVDALLSLLEEGVVHPGAERLAERAGVSRRAIFHHFRDLEDLLATAGDRQMERVVPTLSPLPREGSTAARIEAFVAQRCRLLERIAPVRRAALLVEPLSPVVGTRLAAVRRRGRRAVEEVFAPELAAVPAEERAELAAALSMASSFSAWESIHTHQGLSADQTARVMKRAITALLAPRSLEPKSPAESL